MAPPELNRARLLEVKSDIDKALSADAARDWILNYAAPTMSGPGISLVAKPRIANACAGVAEAMAYLGRAMCEIEDGIVNRALELAEADMAKVAHL